MKTLYVQFFLSVYLILYMIIEITNSFINYYMNNITTVKYFSFIILMNYIEI